MTQSPFSVANLFAERDAARQKEKSEEEQLRQKQNEEREAFRKRLEEFKLTDEHVTAVLDRIRRAFHHGDTELLLTQFPCSFCHDQGRMISSMSLPKPPERITDAPAPKKAEEPAWLVTLPAGVRQVYEYWETYLKPGGFGFTARIMDYPGGMPGDVGLFFTWPKSATGL